jgi:hypothetical protein
MDALITRLKHEIEFLSTEGFVLTEKRTITLLEDCLEALTSQWVSVADRLPEKDVEVLVLNTNAEIQLDTWVDLYESPVSFSTKSICVGEGWESSDFEDVTHWCALPPIEQEQE